MIVQPPDRCEDPQFPTYASLRTATQSVVFHDGIWANSTKESIKPANDLCRAFNLLGQ